MQTLDLSMTYYLLHVYGFSARLRPITLGRKMINARDHQPIILDNRMIQCVLEYTKEH